MQPTGICAGKKNVFIVDTAVGKMKMVVGCNGLRQYLEHLHLFSAVPGVHKKSEKPIEFSLDEAISALKKVYDFDKSCVNAVKEDLQSTGVTQGHQGTISDATIQDQQQILLALQNLKEIFTIRSTQSTCSISKSRH